MSLKQTMGVVYSHGHTKYTTPGSITGLRECSSSTHDYFKHSRASVVHPAINAQKFMSFESSMHMNAVLPGPARRAMLPGPTRRAMHGLLRSVNVSSDDEGGEPAVRSGHELSSVHQNAIEGVDAQNKADGDIRAQMNLHMRIRASKLAEQKQVSVNSQTRSARQQRWKRQGRRRTAPLPVHRSRTVRGLRKQAPAVYKRNTGLLPLFKQREGAVLQENRLDDEWDTERKHIQAGLLESANDHMDSLLRSIAQQRIDSYHSTQHEGGRVQAELARMEMNRVYAVEEAQASHEQQQFVRDQASRKEMEQLRVRSELQLHERRNKFKQQFETNRARRVEEIARQTVMNDRVRDDYLRRIQQTLGVESARHREVENAKQARLEAEDRKKKQECERVQRDAEAGKERKKLLRTLAKTKRQMHDVRRFAKQGNLTVSLMGIEDLESLPHGSLFRVVTQVRFLAKGLQKFTHYTPYFAVASEFPASQVVEIPVTNAPLQLLDIHVQAASAKQMWYQDKKRKTGWVEETDPIDSGLKVIGSLHWRIVDVRSTPDGVIVGSFPLKMKVKRSHKTRLTLLAKLEPALGGEKMRAHKKMMRTNADMEKALKQLGEGGDAPAGASKEEDALATALDMGSAATLSTVQSNRVRHATAPVLKTPQGRRPARKKPQAAAQDEFSPPSLGVEYKRMREGVLHNEEEEEDGEVESLEDRRARVDTRHSEILQSQQESRVVVEPKFMPVAFNHHQIAKYQAEHSAHQQHPKGSLPPSLVNPTSSLSKAPPLPSTTVSAAHAHTPSSSKSRSRLERPSKGFKPTPPNSESASNTHDLQMNRQQLALMTIMGRSPARTSTLSRRGTSSLSQV